MLHKIHKRDSSRCLAGMRCGEELGCLVDKTALNYIGMFCDKIDTAWRNIMDCGLC